jgi:ubiquinone/menaquinone biosynthesis C-methylase UbiE
MGETGIEKSWDKMALAYENFTEGENSYSYAIEWPCILGLLPRLDGASVLDLGCGTGRFTFLLEKLHPRETVGIDLSGQMLALAKSKAKQKESKAAFIKGDISDLENLVDGKKYDFVFSSTVTHYIQNLNKLFTSVYHVMKQHGICIFSVIHPVYSAQYPLKHKDRFPTDDEWTVRYLDKTERAYIQPWIEYNDKLDNYLSYSYHHTVSDYINAMVFAGFTIMRIEEPYPPKKWKDSMPNRYDAYLQTPSFMIFKIQK